jgi:TldD protein
MSTVSLNLARQILLEPAALSDRQLNRLLDNLLSYHIDSADLYFQSTHTETWSLEDGLVKNGGFNIDQGVGIRAISGEKTGFAYSEDLHFDALMSATNAARSIAKHGQLLSAAHFKHPSLRPLLYQPVNPLLSISDAQKLALLQDVDSMARSMHPAICQVNASLQAHHEIVLIVNHEGQLVADVRPVVRMNVSVIAERNGRREQGFAGEGKRADYQLFIQGNTAHRLVEESVRQAILNLEAGPAPAGTMPVVLGSGWAGVLTHEAVGHGLEGDFNRKGSSAFSGRIGERVASSICTIVDDGTLPNRCGSLNIDDEGNATEHTVLIENGILKNYMQDSLNARLMGVKSTGNGRRESYAHLPMPRMTNTYILPGQHTPEEIIASVDKGLYAVNFSGGQVDITSGKFVFSACEAYLIENGKITRPVKGATLIGNGPDALTRVSMVGNDLQLDPGIGFCGKNGQTVPVSVGQPTLKIDALTVGGTLQ